MADAMPLTPKPRPILWFALLAAPSAWAALLLLGWSVEGGACGSGPVLGLSMHGLRAVEGGMGIVAVIVTGAALWTGWRCFHGSKEPETKLVHAKTRPEFMVTAALFVGIAMSVGVLMLAASVAFLPLCESMR